MSQITTHATIDADLDEFKLLVEIMLEDGSQRKRYHRMVDRVRQHLLDQRNTIRLLTTEKEKEVLASEDLPQSPPSLPTLEHLQSL